MRRIQNFFKNMPIKLTAEQRDRMLVVAVGFLAGMVVGMLCSPRKNAIYGCYNEGGNAAAGNPEEVGK